MKVNEPNRIAGLQQYNSNRGQRTEQTEAVKRKDQVTISSEAKELLESNRINQAGRAEQLSQLKQAVSSGTYHVEAGKIAEKLLPYLK
ncbi:flagellar biosynthesis anti-sigma factor FlgM [Paenibacillus sp. 1P07SE]|uniref:flagellar biosynthesis anti-sigma factor FlgM n=1 Tax=Paenibacillus sp. 1P07SE TaxID=3132209 RepID=UPI0039A415FE